MAEPLLSPDCRDGKCVACHGDAFDEAADEIVQCECGCHTFARLADDVIRHKIVRIPDEAINGSGRKVSAEDIDTGPDRENRRGKDRD